MKKARKWLDNNNLEYEFHDYKKLGVPEKNLKRWVKQAGWEVVLNKRGTTWRKLDDDIKNSIDAESSIQVMLDNPSAIKRPVLEYGKTLLIGFKEGEYKTLL
jgi:arsenate reductase